MNRVQFRVLYREFLFRIVDLDLLSSHAKGDSSRLLGQFAALLVFFSMLLAMAGGFWAANVKGNAQASVLNLVNAWTAEHFLIATTMLTVGVFAVLSWESTFPDRRDVLVIGPLPVAARTLFLAKVAAVGTALGLTLAALHVLAGIAWPLALAQFDPTPAPALMFDPQLPPVHAADFPAVMNRDIAPMLSRLDLAAADGGAGIVIGISDHGVRRIMTYGKAKPDSMFEIGSVTKTFTGLLLAQMAVEGKVDLHEPVRDLLPAGLVNRLSSSEITLLDLATHHSGLPSMPDNGGRGDLRETYTDYRTEDLYDFVQRHGLGKPRKTEFRYSNLGFALLGAALVERAKVSYPELVERDITGPLGMKDTVITLSADQQKRLMQGYGADRQPTQRWDLQAYASAGGLRSTASDMLAYLEAELHPEKTPFAAGLKESQRLRAKTAGGGEIGLAWMYIPNEGVYAHNGGTGGFSSDVRFDPRRDFAAVVLMNTPALPFPFVSFLAEHVHARFSGNAALSLTPVLVPAAGPVRSFLAYWMTMIAAGVFTFCCVLGLQGIAAQVLPRRMFLRASAFLQLGVFCILVTGYCLQRMPVTVLVSGPDKPWTAWIPSYWFVGMYQQLSGSLHPALAPFARRAWVGLVVAMGVTSVAYAASYLRTLRKIVEQPDVAPSFKNVWLPRFGGSFETAIAQFSIRTLWRSRQHRMILAFYLGVALALALFFLNAPQEISGPVSGDMWHQPSVPMIASTIVLMGFWVMGARVVFNLPLDLRANWIFRVMPFRAGPGCLKGRRRALLAISVAPALAIAAALVLPLWPWRPAVEHLALLAFFGVFLAEFSLSGVQKIPFACSYLPGKSHINITFLLWLYLVLAGVLGAAAGEIQALANPASIFTILAIIGGAALFAVIRNNRLARPDQAELRYEEVPPDQVLSMELS